MEYIVRSEVQSQSTMQFCTYSFLQDISRFLAARAKNKRFLNLPVTHLVRHLIKKIGSLYKAAEVSYLQRSPITINGIYKSYEKDFKSWNITFLREKLIAFNTYYTREESFSKFKETRNKQNRIKIEGICKKNSLISFF